MDAAFRHQARPRWTLVSGYLERTVPCSDLPRSPPRAGLCSPHQGSMSQGVGPTGSTQGRAWERRGLVEAAGQQSNTGPVSPSIKCPGVGRNDILDGIAAKPPRPHDRLGRPGGGDRITVGHPGGQARGENPRCPTVRLGCGASSPS